MPDSADREPSVVSSADLRERRLAVLGAGALGVAMARALRRRGARVRLWSRDPERVRAAAAASGVEAAADPAAATSDAELVLLCVHEEGLAAVAADLAGCGPDAGRAALHTAGALGPAVLEPLARTGWSTGKLHPLCAVSPAAPELGAGVWWALAGDGAARAWGERIARALDGRLLALTDDRDGGDAAARRYHAAASLVAGGAVALMDLALEAAAGTAAEAELRPALAALLASAAANVERGPTADALSGPIARGAAALVREQRASLAAEAPEAAAIYVALGRRMLALARRRGALAPERLAALERALGDA